MPYVRHNDGFHLETVLRRTKCTKHKADEGSPCYTFYRADGGLLRGACNKRITMAGFVGKISPASLRLNEPGGRTKWRGRV